MNKHLLTLVAVTGFISVAGAQVPAKLVFKGNADKAFDGNTIVLYNHEAKEKDSAIIKDGHFEFALDYKAPSRYMFYSKYELEKKKGYAPWGILVAKPGVVQMDVKVDSMAGTVVSGAPDNSLFDLYQQEGQKSSKKIMDQLASKYGQAFIDTLTPKNARYKEIVEDYQALNKAAMPAQIARLEQLVTGHPGSYASVFALGSAANMLDAPKLEQLYNTLSSENKQTPAAQKIAGRINAGKITAIGNTAPEFAQTDTSGKEVALKDFRGKYVLVDFWASWCGPCRAENPNVVNAFHKFKHKGFTVLGVSLDRPGDKNKWLDAIHKDQLTWTHVSDLKFWDNAAAKLYGVQAIPQNFLLDPQGKIVAVNVKGEELEKKLLEIVK